MEVEIEATNNKVNDDEGSSGNEEEEPNKNVKRKDKDEKKARKEKKAAARENKETEGAGPSLRNVRIGVAFRMGYRLRLSVYTSSKSTTIKTEHVAVTKVLTNNDMYLELATSCRAFMVEARKVDETFVVEPVDPKNTGVGGVENLKKLPINYISLTAAIKVLDNAEFEKSKSWGRKK